MSTLNPTYLYINYGEPSYSLISWRSAITRLNIDMLLRDGQQTRSLGAFMLVTPVDGKAKRFYRVLC